MLLRGPLLTRAEGVTAAGESLSGTTVHCETGEVDISGGAQWNALPGNAPIIESVPNGSGAWNINVFNPTDQPQDWHAVALCAKLDWEPPLPPGP